MGRLARPELLFLSDSVALTLLQKHRKQKPSSTRAPGSTLIERCNPEPHYYWVVKPVPFPTGAQAMGQAKIHLQVEDI